MQNNLKIGNQVTFHNEPMPYELKAVSERYAIATRKFNELLDKNVLENLKGLGRCLSFQYNINGLTNHAIYSILDFGCMTRGADNLSLNEYCYWKQLDIDRCLDDLQSGNVGISHHTKCNLIIQKVEYVDGERLPASITWSNSSNVSITEYDVFASVLRVTFKNNTTYCYEAVPSQVWKQLTACESIGSFIAKNIVKKYKSVKL